MPWFRCDTEITIIAPMWIEAPDEATARSAIENSPEGGLLALILPSLVQPLVRRKEGAPIVIVEAVEQIEGVDYVS